MRPLPCPSDRSTRGARPATLRTLALAALLVLAGACRESRPTPEPALSATSTAADSQAAHIRDVVAAGGVVDSILPIAEHLRRFQAAAGSARDTLQYASATRRDLITRWVRAVAAQDTASLNAMLLDRAEFAWLYYPESKMARPPYEAPPELLWGQLLESSDEGARRVLARLGGKAVTIDSERCAAPVVKEGPNALHEGCTVTLRVDGAVQNPATLFGTILERDGRFKFVGYTNRL